MNSCWLDLWACSYPLGVIDVHTPPPFNFLSFNFSFTGRSVWSLPISAPLSALTSCSVPLHLLFFSTQPIWFCVWPSGEVHFNLWMFLCWKMVPPIISFVFLTKVYKPASIFVNHTTTMFTHCEFLPFVVCATFSIEISQYEKYIMDWCFLHCFLQFFIKGVLVFLLFVFSWWVADYNSQFGIFRMESCREKSIAECFNLSYTSLVFCWVLSLHCCCAAHHFFLSIKSDDQWQVSSPGSCPSYFACMCLVIVPVHFF